jgi:xanthosine utilization system XapX-like protein
VPLLRWLVPVVTALVLVGTAVTSWAAAGSGKPACCCLDPAKCKCHEHGAASGATAKMKACKTGDRDHVAPMIAVAVVPAVAAVAAEAPRVVAVAEGVVGMIDGESRAPETPPF